MAINQIICSVLNIPDREIWVSVLKNLGAKIVDKDYKLADIVFANRISKNERRAIFYPKKKMTIDEFEQAVFFAIRDHEEKILNLLGIDKNSISESGRQLIVLLYLAGDDGVSGHDLMVRIGYDEKAKSHTVETMIYALRKQFGDQFLVFDSGRYKIGRI